MFYFFRRRDIEETNDVQRMSKVLVDLPEVRITKLYIWEADNK